MNQRDAEVIAELRSTLEILQNENQLLSERAEEILLLRLVAESIATVDHWAQLLETILEKVSILKDIPFCACCEQTSQGLLVLSSYVSFSMDNHAGTQIVFSSKIKEQSKENICILDNEALQHGAIKIEFDTNEFVPTSVMLCPFAAKSISNGVFLFADSQADSERLSNLSPLLQNIVSMASDKLDKLALQKELKEMNEELERRVQVRTQSLHEANEQLHKETADRIHMQELMLQSEKMRSLGTMVAGMAHEINNPLAGIIQNAHTISFRLTNMQMVANQRAAERAGISLEAMQRFFEERNILRMLSAVIDSGQRVANIVENMLRFARKSGANLVPCQLTELLDKALVLASADFNIKTNYDFKNIELRKEYENDLPLVPCEESKIQQALLNILRNGAQAMNEGMANARNQGQIPTPPRFILRVASDGDDMVRIEIEDNGPGMDASTQKRIFEPFFTTKPIGEGTGLGLGISYFIVTENHGGMLEIKSEPGLGATFIIRLPLKQKEPESVD